MTSRNELYLEFADVLILWWGSAGFIITGTGQRAQAWLLCSSIPLQAMTCAEPSSLHLSCSQWSCWLVSAFIVVLTVAFRFHLSLCGSKRPPGIQIFLMRERMPLGKGPEFKLGLCFISIEIWALTWISTWGLYWFTEQSSIGKEKRLHLKEISDPERKGKG